MSSFLRIIRIKSDICKIPHCKSSFTSGNWEMAWKDYVHSAIVAKIGDEFVDFLSACFQFRVYMSEMF